MSAQNDQSDLLDRDTFRESVLSRDGHKCVICGRGDPLDAHHILERRLWEDGGYYLANGATFGASQELPISVGLKRPTRGTGLRTGMSASSAPQACSVVLMQEVERYHPR